MDFLERCRQIVFRGEPAANLRNQVGSDIESFLFFYRDKHPGSGLTARKTRMKQHEQSPPTAGVIELRRNELCQRGIGQTLSKWACLKEPRSTPVGILEMSAFRNVNHERLQLPVLNAYRHLGK